MKENDKLCLGTVKLGIPDYGFSSENKAEKQIIAPRTMIIYLLY